MKIYATTSCELKFVPYEPNRYDVTAEDKPDSYLEPVIPEPLGDWKLINTCVNNEKIFWTWTKDN